jgi:hypothetical protein
MNSTDVLLKRESIIEKVTIRHWGSFSMLIIILKHFDKPCTQGSKHLCVGNAVIPFYRKENNTKRTLVLPK